MKYFMQKYRFLSYFNQFIAPYFREQIHLKTTLLIILGLSRLINVSLLNSINNFISFYRKANQFFCIRENLSGFHSDELYVLS